jgi:hypothetical protein
MRAIAGIRALAAFFAVLGLAALVIGVHDFSIASASFGLTVGSSLLIVIGAVQLVAAFHLLKLGLRRTWPDGKRPPCKQRVLVACLLTIILGVYLFLSAIGTPSGQRWFVVAFAIFVVGVAVAGLSFVRREVGLALPRVQTAVALTVAGLVIGLSEFWYQHQYAPAHLGRAVSLSAALELVGTNAGYDVVRAKLGYEAKGGRDVAVIGSTYTLTGARVVRCNRPPTPKKVQAFFRAFNVDPQRSHFMTDAWEVQPSTVLAAGKFVADGKRLDVDVPAERELVFFVPHGRYQLLRLRAQLFGIAASVPLSRTALPTYLTIPGDNDEYGIWRIDDYSWLHALVYGRRRWVVFRYELAAPPTNEHVSPDLRVTASFLHPTWSEAVPSTASLQRPFAKPAPSDSSEPFADSELALAPLAAPIPKDKCPAESPG